MACKDGVCEINNENALETYLEKHGKDWVERACNKYEEDPPLNIERVDLLLGICPECFTDVHSDWVACPYCGKRLDWSTDL